MSAYPLIILIVILILSFPDIRMFFKRLRILIALKRNKRYSLEYRLFDFFSAMRISKGFSLIDKATNERLDVYIVFAHNRRESIEFTDTQFRIKKILRLMGGRIGAGTNMSWHTEYQKIPDFILRKNKNKTFLLFSPVPLSITHKEKDIYPDDTLFGCEVTTGTKLLSRIDNLR